MFVWDDKALELIAGNYATALHASMEKTWNEVIRKGVSVWNVQIPAPLVRIQDKLQLRCRATVLRQGRGPVQGLRLQCFGLLAGTAGCSRVLREENVLPDTSTEDQRCIMDAMCDIVAVQESCDYRLIKPHQVVTPKKRILRPERGRR